jgi:hypothetical protein
LPPPASDCREKNRSRPGSTRKERPAI